MIIMRKARTMSKPTALQVMRIALQQYGYTEHPAGSNKTKFGKAFGLNGEPWCAEFSWYCGWMAAGKVDKDNPIAKSANAADIQIMTVNKKGGVYILKQTSNNKKKEAALPKVKFGDEISFNFNGGTSRAHTGLVVGVYGNYIWCIEGNTSFTESGSQSNGGAVALRERYYTTGVCIVQPDYAPFEWHKPTTNYTGVAVSLPARGWFKYGDKGSKVKALQEALTWANGYKLAVDGEMYGYTFAEVVIFQCANGLKPDGEFGEECLAALNKLIDKNKPKIDDSTDEKPEVDTLPTTADFVPVQGDLCYDLSNHQGKLSVEYFEGIKKKGVKSVILRSSYTKMAMFKMYKDLAFDNNIKNAIEAGMHIGIYHFSSAITPAESKKEAEFVEPIIAPYAEYIDLPVAFDCEFGSKTADGPARFTAAVAKKLGKVGMQNIIDAFCNEIKMAGYEPMLYANLNMFNNYLPAGIYSRYKIWIAQYNKTCDFKHPYFLWQFTSNNGKLDESKFGTQDTKKKKSNAKKLSEKAQELAWPYGTPKKTYKSKPTPEYTAALNRVYPDRSKWGAKPRKGMSCDVFVGTCVRDSGIDKKYPRGLDDQIEYAKKSDNFKKVTVKSAADLKEGDIIQWVKKSGTGHTCIYRGSNLVCEAGYKTERYGCTVKLAKSKFNEKYIKNTYKIF